MAIAFVAGQEAGTNDAGANTDTLQAALPENATAGNSIVVAIGTNGDATTYRQQRDRHAEQCVFATCVPKRNAGPAASGLVAHATSKAASSASDTVQIASHDSGTDANRVLEVSVRVRKASGTCEVTGVTCGASALTKKVGALDDFDGIVRAESWYLYLPPEGASAVTASFSSAADGAEIVATTWNGSAGLGPNTDTAVGSLTNVSMGLTSQAATSKLVGAWAGLDARVVTPGTGVTEIDSL
jgi:hypothetical protein